MSSDSSSTGAKPSVIVIGGCIVDLVSYVTRFPNPGETLIGSKFHKANGGKGANQCVMVALLGEPVAMIAKVGNDSFADDFYTLFKSLSINHDHLTVEKSSHTGTANIAVTLSGENTIVNVFGAIDYLSPADIDKAADLFQGCKILICTYECPRETLLHALKLAKTVPGLKTVVNAAPCGPEPYEELYPFIDILCVNEIEAEFVCGQKVSTKDEAEVAAKSLFARGGFKALILTLGGNGALVLSKEHPEPIHVQAPKVKAIDTTGAGDAFMGSFAYFLVNYGQLSLEEVTRRACVVASVSVQSEGTQMSFPAKKDLSPDLFR